MLVESYEMTEAENEEENVDERISLLERLEIEGQKTLVRSGRVFTFPEMTAEEKFVFETLCPRTFQLKDYKQSLIPLRVLQIIAKAKDCVEFSEIIIRDHESSMMVDPVAVGLIREGYNVRYFLLARWGKELDTYSTLLAKALQAKKVEAMMKLDEILQRAKARLDYLRNGEITSMEEVKIPSYYD